jgi:hypothetical protein
VGFLEFFSKGILYLKYIKYQALPPVFYLDGLSFLCSEKRKKTNRETINEENSGQPPID